MCYANANAPTIRFLPTANSIPSLATLIPTSTSRRKRPTPQQSEDLLKDLERELISADTYVSELETRTLLAGENPITSTPS